MRRASAVVCGVLLLAAAFAVWPYVDREPEPASRAAPAVIEPPAATSAPVPETPIRIRPHRPPYRPPPPLDLILDAPPLDEVRELLVSTYFGVVPEEVLEQQTVELMLARLGDPYGDYLDPEEFEAFRDRLNRTYFGVGLVVGPDEGGLVVTSAQDGPAREAGIRPGDVIVSIDGELVSGLPFERSTQLIKGEIGTEVNLEVKRQGQKQPIRFSVVRAELDAPSVRAKLMKVEGRKIGYIRIVSFADDVALLVATKTNRLAERGVEGFVLDLRGDPGGLLDQAVGLASLYLDAGLVCATQSVHESRDFFVRGEPVDTTRPIVVLVDSGTASAAEVVAAALAENGRAHLVGNRTFGKASVQSVMGLSNGGALKVTTANFVTPSGTTIAGRGIDPEIPALDDPRTRPDEALIAAKQALLEHL